MNRFSLNSVQSNVSGISDLISTQMTSYNGDDEEPKLELPHDEQERDDKEDETNRR